MDHGGGGELYGHLYIYIPAWDWPKTKTKVALFEEHLPTGVVFVGVFLSTEVFLTGEKNTPNGFPVFKRTVGGMIQSDIRNTVNLFFCLGDSLNLRANLNLDLPSTLPKTYSSPLKMGLPKRKVFSQPPISGFMLIFHGVLIRPPPPSPWFFTTHLPTLGSPSPSRHARLFPLVVPRSVGPHCVRNCSHPNHPPRDRATWRDFDWSAKYDIWDSIYIYIFDNGYIIYKD